MTLAHLRSVVFAAAGALLLGALAARPVLAQGDGPAPAEGPATPAPKIDFFPVRNSLALPGAEESAAAAEPTPSGAPQGGGLGAGSIGGRSGRFKDRSRNAPFRESRTAIGIYGKHVNGLLGGFEQGAGIGLGIELTTADSLPGVELRASLLASIRFYRRFEVEAYFPKVFSDNTHAQVWFSYLRRTRDNFFGIGPRIPNIYQTNFDWEHRSYNATLFHDFTEHLQAGLYGAVANTSSYNGENDQDIPFDQLFSGDPNVVPVTSWAPGFQMNTKIFFYGGFAEYDRRNDERGLTKGGYLYANIGSADGLEIKDDVFSDYGWHYFIFDARGYIPVFSDKTSIALRSFTELRSPKGNSQIPFYDMAFLGGRNFGRGFRNFRFRGNNLQLFAAEVRQTIYTREEDSGLDIHVFGDLGQVWGDNRSRTDPQVLANDKFDSKNWRTGFGGGFQYRYSKDLGLRIEAGRSNERTLIYFSIGRGF